MAGAENIAAEKESEQRAFEQLDGEIDAAIVFAAGAKAAYRNGRAELGDACFSDAKDGHNKVIESLSRTDLAGEQLRSLQAKMKYLRESLDRLRNISFDRGEAASNGKWSSSISGLAGRLKCPIIS